MSEQLSAENQATLATIAAAISFPYIWGGLFLLLYLLFGVNFFGEGLGGGLVAALLCIGLANPLVPGAVATFVARPIYRNLLARQIMTAPGCLVGLIGFALTALSMLFFLARDFQLALVLFAAAPIVGAALAGGLSLLGRSNLRLGRGRRAAPPVSGGRAPLPRVPEGRKPPPLPRPSRPPSRLPPPRRPPAPPKRRG